MVIMRQPENSAGLYHTTGSVVADPVSKPFTIKKGSKQTKKATTNWVSHLGLTISKTTLKAKANSTEEYNVLWQLNCAHILVPIFQILSTILGMKGYFAIQKFMNICSIF